jgi:succinate-semialdehyde dehydrogenase/glutarate-semialdehyde dehydrogenase
MTKFENFLIKNGSYINGKWHETGDATFEVKNPADGSVVKTLVDASDKDLDEAIAAAEAALPAWAAKTATERAIILRRWYDLIMKNQEELAHIMTMEQGKPLAEARGEIAYGASYVEWFAEEAKRIYGDTIPAPAGDKRIVVIKQPVGVVATVTPWNFPSSMITRKVAPALAAGCTVLSKPAKETPLSAIALAVLAEEAGIPPGVFNMVVTTRSREVGVTICEDERIAKMSFTGSTGVGARLLSQCAGTIKKASMELGGNAPFIVFDDADIDAAVEGAVASKYRNAGQTCVCTNRILVQEGIKDEFIEKFTSKVKELKLGVGTDESVDIGPVVNVPAVEAIEGLIAAAVEAGAKIITGGKRSDLGACFFEPTILSDVTMDMKVAYKEIFGPIAPIITFKDEAEALAIANDTVFGLAAYFYTRDIGRIWRVAEALEFGMVGINEGLISNPMAPFGGVKQSGLGREGSKYGIGEYLEIKYLCMGGLDKSQVSRVL